MLVQEMIRQSLRLPGITLQPGETCQTLHYADPAGGGAGTTAFYSLFQGVTLAYTTVKTPSWPVPALGPEMEGHRLLVLGYCVESRSRMQTDSGETIYINSGEIAITRGFAVREYTYAQKGYRGVELLVDLDDLGEEKHYLKRDFGVDFSLLEKLYCPDGKPYTGPCVEAGKAVVKKLWSLAEEPGPYALQQMRMYTVAAVGMLLNRMNTPGARQGSFLTEGQISIARETRALLCKDLSRHFTVADLAKKFGVSESSLKSYFRNVYGKSLSAYQHDLRMETGAALLECSDSSVAEIATRMGYVRQSKFAEAFRKRYGVSPLEYRRMHPGKNTPASST